MSRLSAFADLYELVDSLTGNIRGLGDLYVYDTALRIGARLRLEPEAVYVHAGTKRGANRLGLPAQHSTLPMQSLPSQLANLKPMEVEDLLCIYKQNL